MSSSLQNVLIEDRHSRDFIKSTQGQIQEITGFLTKFGSIHLTRFDLQRKACKLGFEIRETGGWMYFVGAQDKGINC